VKSSAARLQSGCKDWLPNYWILFDIWWGGIAALTHICSHPPSADGQSGLPALLHSVQQQCSDIIDAFPWGPCENDTPSILSIILRTFAVEPYPVCACYSCNCFGSILQSSPNNAVSTIIQSLPCRLLVYLSFFLHSLSRLPSKRCTHRTCHFA
jgi:hypothetical protein